MHDKIYKVTFKHVSLIAKELGLEPIAVFNGLLIGKFKKELEQLI
jgi:hypothetical protein